MKKNLVLLIAFIAFFLPKMASAYTEIGNATTYDYRNLYCLYLAICFTDNDPSNTTFKPGKVYIISNLNGLGQDVRAVTYSAVDDGDGGRSFPFEILQNYSVNSEATTEEPHEVQLFPGIDKHDIIVYAFNNAE